MIFFLSDIGKNNYHMSSILPLSPGNIFPQEYYNTLTQIYYDNIFGNGIFHSLYDLLFLTGLDKFKQIKWNSSTDWNSKLKLYYPNHTARSSEGKYFLTTERNVDVKDVIDFSFPEESRLAIAVNIPLKVLRIYIGLFNDFIAASVEDVDFEKYEFNTCVYDKLVILYNHPAYSEFFDLSGKKEYAVWLSNLRTSLFPDSDNKLECIKYNVIDLNHGNCVKIFTKTELIKRYATANCGSSQCFCKAAVILSVDGTYVNAYKFANELKDD